MALIETNVRLLFNSLQENLKYQSVAYFWYLMWEELSKQRLEKTKEHSFD